MNDFIEYLRRFNSKERFYLVGHLLGNSEFLLASDSVDQISGELDISIPKGAFAAMDFHLDWLYASLYKAFAGDQSEVIPNQGKNIAGQQEDIDYLIAFEEGGAYSVILIEAKAKSGWSVSQLDSKANRLSKIFGDDGKDWRNLRPYFMLISPKRPKNIDASGWPSWMRPDSQPTWIELPVPDNLLKVTRCDENGKPQQAGGHWKVVSR